MSEQESGKKGLSRRQFMQQGTLAFAGLLLASCADDEEQATALAPQTALATATQETAPTAVATEAVAQVDASATAPQAPATDETPPTTTVTEAPTLAPTPQCDDDDDTPAQTEGPFYTPDTPQKTSFLEDGAGGTPLVLTGVVLSTSCEPIANAVVDFWHADEAGQYDNSGFRYRGHQFTDAQGRYNLETILPGLYPGRTRHIHVKAQGEATPLLTTQLYFPGEPGNANDGIFDEALLVEMAEAADGQAATFNFVLERSA